MNKIDLQKNTIFFNYVYEILKEDIVISHYKRHSSKSEIEQLLVSLFNHEDSVLSSNLYYIYHLISTNNLINENGLASQMSFLKTKDAKMEILTDVLSLTPLFSSTYLLLKKFVDREKPKIDDKKIFLIYNICEKIYKLGTKIIALYYKEGDFNKEINNSFIELVRYQVKNDIEKDILSIYKSLKSLKKGLIERNFILFDVFENLKNTLLINYYRFDETAKDNSRNKIIKFSSEPFIYFYKTYSNMMSQMALHFIENKNILNYDKETLILKKIENVSTSIIFAICYEADEIKKRTYSTIALDFFIDDNEIAKYSFIKNNEEEIKSFFVKFFNLKCINSYTMKSIIEKELENIYNEKETGNDRDTAELIFILKEFTRKIPLIIHENAWIISSDINKENFIEDLATKLYEYFLGFLQEKYNN